MEVFKRQEKILVLTILSVILTILFSNTTCYATNTGIGTAEIASATENIKRVITSIAMPLRRCLNFC